MGYFSDMFVYVKQEGSKSPSELDYSAETLKAIRNLLVLKPDQKECSTIEGLPHRFDLQTFQVVGKKGCPSGLTLHGKPVFANDEWGSTGALQYCREKLQNGPSPDDDNLLQFIHGQVSVNLLAIMDSTHDAVHKLRVQLQEELTAKCKESRTHDTSSDSLQANAVEQREIRAAFAKEQSETRAAHAVEQRETRALLAEAISMMSAQRPSAAQRRPQGNFSSMKVRELQAKCRDLGLKTGGRKQELIARLNQAAEATPRAVAAVTPRNLFDT